MRSARWPLRSSLSILATFIAAPALATDFSVANGPPIPPSLASPFAALNDVAPQAQRAAAPILEAGPICDLIKASADRHKLPRAFLARLIWKESRFDTKAVSPVGAQGIAQFMPQTAKIEGLRNPFDPYQAIPAAAKHLADMRREFGNLGLAAIGYNAGRGRASAFSAGSEWLPYETRDYVASILHRAAEAYRDGTVRHPVKPLKEGLAFEDACRKLPVMRTRALGRLVRVAPRMPWGVQVAGHFNRSVAMAGWRRARGRLGSIVAGKKPFVVRERGRAGMKRVHSVRLGADSRTSAQALCRQIRSRGGFCLVKKTR